MDLPAAVQRRLAGPPLVRDGEPLAVDTQLMLRLTQLGGQGKRPEVGLAAERQLFSKQSALAGGRQPIGSVRSLTAGTRPARLYVPAGAPAFGPLLVFLHGGGFVFGDLDSHDASCRFLAERSGTRILAIDYRLAPEHPFPAGYEDAVEAFAWAYANAERLGADQARIGVGGDSAGANLAAGIALAAGATCAFQLLLYPPATPDHDTPSGRLFGAGFFLTAEFIELVGGMYLTTREDAEDPRFCLLNAEIPDGVAPAYVATAGFDPLRDEGEAYARKLEEAGVKVELRRFGDQIHGFLNVLAGGRSAKGAVLEIAEVLRTRL
jgi:acetyl esterase